MSSRKQLANALAAGLIGLSLATPAVHAANPCSPCAPKDRSASGMQGNPCAANPCAAK